MAAVTKGSGTFALAAHQNGLPVVMSRTEFGRPSPGPSDVDIVIAFCGICHSDLHSVCGDWGEKTYPFTPGHEIAGTVTSVGSHVTKYAAGDRVGVGCFVSSCRECAQCASGAEQYCARHVKTYGYAFPDGHPREAAGEITRGGYSDRIVVDEHFVFRVPEGMSLAEAGPLLCAGVTTYSPLARHVLGRKGIACGILGFGGLGHMAAKIAGAMGAKVTILSRSRKKEAEARGMGCGIIVHSDEEAMKAAVGSFDVILDTASAKHDIIEVMKTLKVGGTLVLLGGGPGTPEINPRAMLGSRQSIEGSLVGGCRETEDMLQFCVDNDVRPAIDIIPCTEVTAAFHALSQGEVAKRHVIDMSTLGDMEL